MGPYGWTSRLFAPDLIRIGWCEGFLGRCSTNQRLAICILTLPDFLRQYLCDLHFCKQLRTTFAWFQGIQIFSHFPGCSFMMECFDPFILVTYIYSLYLHMWRYTHPSFLMKHEDQETPLLEHQIQELGGDAWHLSSLEAQSWWQYLSGVRGH